MKVGIASSMWQGLADLPFPEYVAYCQQAGAEVIELSGWPKSYGGSLKLDAEGIAQVQRLTRRVGIPVIAIGSPDDLVQPTAAGMAEQVRMIKGYVDLATELGATVVSMKVGTPKEGLTSDEAIALIIRGLTEVTPYASDHKVFLALENRSTLTNSVEVMQKILHDVHSLYLRVLLDTGNLLQYGLSPDDVLAAVEQLAPYTVHCHLKDGRGHRQEFRPAPLGQGELNIEQIIRILQVSGYLHPLCVQYEGPDQPRIYAEDVRYVRDRTAGWEITPNDELVRGIHHLAISGRGFANAYRFYGEVLGLPLKSAQGTSYSPVLLFALPTGQELHVHLHGPSQHTHVAIEVADFAAAARRLREAGVTISPPDRRGDGSDFLFCDDLDGNRIEITHHDTWVAARLIGES